MFKLVEFFLVSVCVPNAHLFPLKSALMRFRIIRTWKSSFFRRQIAICDLKKFCRFFCRRGVFLHFYPSFAVTFRAEKMWIAKMTCNASEIAHIWMAYFFVSSDSVLFSPRQLSQAHRWRELVYLWMFVLLSVSFFKKNILSVHFCGQNTNSLSFSFFQLLIIASITVFWVFFVWHFLLL